GAWANPRVSHKGALQDRTFLPGGVPGGSGCAQMPAKVAGLSVKFAYTRAAESSALQEGTERCGQSCLPRACLHFRRALQFHSSNLEPRIWQQSPGRRTAPSIIFPSPISWWRNCLHPPQIEMSVKG